VAAAGAAAPAVSGAEPVDTGAGALVAFAGDGPDVRPAPPSFPAGGGVGRAAASFAASRAFRSASAASWTLRSWSFCSRSSRRFSRSSAFRASAS
jgi:hypothetical protein